MRILKIVDIPEYFQFVIGLMLKTTSSHVATIRTHEIVSQGQYMTHEKYNTEINETAPSA